MKSGVIIILILLCIIVGALFIVWVVKKKEHFSQSLYPIVQEKNCYRLGDTSSPPIIMIMGWMCSISMWSDTFIASLLDKYSIILFNNPGISSAPNLHPYTFENMSQIIDGFNISNPILFGWSMGAMLAFYYAITRNIPYCVSVCGANVDIGNVIFNPLDVADVYNKFFNAGTPPPYVNTLIYKNAVNQIIPFKEVGYAQGKAMSDYNQNVQTLFSKKIQTHLLFITASDDIVVPPQENIAFLQQHYPSDLLTLFQFPDEGHGVLYTQEIKISQMMKRFLQT